MKAYQTALILAPTFVDATLNLVRPSTLVGLSSKSWLCQN